MRDHIERCKSFLRPLRSQNLHKLKTFLWFAWWKIATMPSSNVVGRDHPTDTDRGCFLFSQHTTLLSHQPSYTSYKPDLPKSHATHAKARLVDEEGASKPRRCWTSVTTWWQEFAAIVLLIGSTIASFATLYPYQGKPLPDW